jgi:hypothetical protein
MLSPDDIRFIAATPQPGVLNPHHGQYVAILSVFPVVQFIDSLDQLDHGLEAMTVHLKTTRTTQKPVFILLIAPNNTSTTSRHAEVTMRRLLKGADGPGINVMHGVCVCGTQAAFYQYDCERQIVSPKSQGRVHFGFDLATEGGATRFLEVAEDVIQMCRGIIPNLEVPAFMDIPDP